MGAKQTEPVREQQEALWIESARRGNREAFGQIVEKYMRDAYYAALALVRNHDDALELSQEAFLRAFCAMKRFREGAKFYPWFYRILRNLCMTHLRKRSRRMDSVPMHDEEGDWEFPDQQPTPAEAVQQVELEERVWEVFQQLGPMDREILLLRDFEDRSYAEIAEALEIPMGTVMSRLYNARRRLKEKMQEYLDVSE